MPMEKPQRLEAEKAVIRCLLEEPDLYYSQDLILTSDMFFGQDNALVYSEVRSLIEAAQEPDLVLVTSRLKDNTLFDTVGGEEYLRCLNKTEFLTSNYADYTSQVYETFLRREIISSGNKVVNAGYQRPYADASDILYSETNRILDISQIGADALSVNQLVAEEFEDFLERRENPGCTGITTGFKPYDLLTGGLYETDEIIVAARPSVGKTSLALRWLLNLAQNAHPGLFFSYEMSRKQIMQRFMSMQSGVELHKIRTGAVGIDDYNAVADATDQIAELPIYISNDVTASASEVSTETKQMVREKGVEFVVVDYLQLMPHRTRYATQDLGNIVRRMKNLAMSTDIVVLMISQLNRRVEMRSDKRPVLSDLRQSGNIEEHADMVLMLYREEMYDPTPDNAGLAELLIRKNRNGPIGSLPLIFEAETVDFAPMD